MPSHKVLQGVAHNIGHSFTSFLNFSTDNYTLGHILKFARKTGIDELEIDLLGGTGKPVELLQEPISHIPDRYSKMFFSELRYQGSSVDFVNEAKLRLRYDLHKERLHVFPPNSGVDTNNEKNRRTESPYRCEVEIIDDRGKQYKKVFEGWWYPEEIWIKFKR